MAKEMIKLDTFDKGLMAVAALGGFIGSQPMVSEGSPTIAYIVVGLFSGLACLVAAGIIIAIRHGALGGAGSGVDKYHISGSKLVDVTKPEPAKNTKKPADEIMIGNVPVPPEKEVYHFAIEGAPGSGKTQTINQILHVARERGDTVVVLDSNYELHKQFGREGDIILSPFDPNGAGWSPINEVRDPHDWGSIFNSFIGEGEGESATWNGMARKFATSTATRYYNECISAGRKFDLQYLFNLLTSASPDVVAEFVEGTSSATLATSDKQLANVRMSLIDGLASWPVLKDGQFSIRDWMELDQRPSIWIPYNKRNQATMKHLMSAWFDQIILSAIDGGKSDKRTWLIIDELGNLGEIGGLVNSTTEVRKPGFRVVTALQDYNQVVEVYGKTRASTLLNNLANKIYFRVGSHDVAERMSRDLGDERVRIVSESYSTSRHGDSKTYSEQEGVERVVIASEITSLPDLTAYVKLAGSKEIQLTKIELYDDWKRKRQNA